MIFTDPHTSLEAKAHAEEVLQAAGIDERQPGHTDEEHLTRVLAGYKAALHSMLWAPRCDLVSDRSIDRSPRV